MKHCESGMGHGRRQAVVCRRTWAVDVVRRLAFAVRPPGRLGLSVCLGLLLSGCITAVPMQTASAVPRGVVRLGGEVSFSPWCSFTVNPLGNCALLVTGTPLPEVRGDVRMGLGDGFDFGASIRGGGVLNRGGQGGLLLDAKKEVFSSARSPGPRWLVSVAPGVAADLVTFWPTVPAVPPAVAFQVSMPAYVGYQTEAWEWVLGVRAQERFVAAQSTPSAFLGVPEFGLSVAVFSQGHPRWGGQLSYQAPFELAASGMFTLSGAVLFDLGTPAP